MVAVRAALSALALPELALVPIRRGAIMALAKREKTRTLASFRRRAASGRARRGLLPFLINLN
jgi:hypothetical protein